VIDHVTAQGTTVFDDGADFDQAQLFDLEDVLHAERDVLILLTGALPTMLIAAIALWIMLP
jgi:hypothetical protein